MPYTRKQCKVFGAKSNRGQKVPGDWKKHCKKGVVKKLAVRKKK